MSNFQTHISIILLSLTIVTSHGTIMDLLLPPFIHSRFTHPEKADTPLGIFSAQHRKVSSGMAALLKGLAKGDDKVTVTIEVNKGLITLSLLPLGHIPPV